MISKNSLKILNESLSDKNLLEVFERYESIKEQNELKVINAFNKIKLNQNDFFSKTGYTFDDIGRSKLEELYSHVFKGEDSLVRPTIISGTHAISLVLNGILRPDDNFIYGTGLPYDTIRKTIGIVKGSSKKNEFDISEGSLIDQKIKFSHVDLKNNKIDVSAILKKINKKTKLIAFQRSIGYDDKRKSLNLDDLEATIKMIKEKHPKIIIFVDNCYGEFVLEKEPIEIGADIIAGSLIKNLGAGIAKGGGYIVGKKDLIAVISNKLSAVGLGKDQGPMYDQTLSIMQSLFFAPSVVNAAVKNASVFSYVYEKQGFSVSPKFNEYRSDIVTRINLNSEENLIHFCEVIQESSLVDNTFMPVPDDMPGYNCKIIMASGSFISGSSIELSADAPLREPYCVYFQGGLNFTQGKIALLKSLERICK